MPSDEVRCAVVVAHVWKTQMWWPVLSRMSERHVDFDVSCHFSLIWDENTGKMQDAGPLRWPVRVFQVSFQHHSWVIWERVTEEEADGEDRKERSKTQARREGRKSLKDSH